MTMFSLQRLLFASLSLALCTADTQIAVLEFGTGGSVHIVPDAPIQTTPDAVVSFWGALHSQRFQHVGMSVMPDLFVRPDETLVVALTGVDLDGMSTVAEVVDDATAVGHLRVAGSQLDKMLTKAGAHVEVMNSEQEMVEASKNHCQHKDGLTGIQIAVEPHKAGSVDAVVGTLLAELKADAIKRGKTIVVHLVVEEDASVSRRRRLEQQDEEQDQQEEDNQQDNEENGQEDGNNNNNNNMYWGYGYYDENQNYVTPFKTPFQIQYFNLVLWTSLGLVATVFFVIYLMLNMPMEPDTLLFGEAVKMPGE